MRIQLLDTIGSGCFAWNRVAAHGFTLPIGCSCLFFVFLFILQPLRCSQKTLSEPKFTHQISCPPLQSLNWLHFLHVSFELVVVLWTHSPKPSSYLWFSLFSCCLVVALFHFCHLFESLKFQSRCLHLASVEHANGLPIETPSFSKLCCCLCTHPVKYIAQRQHNTAAFKFCHSLFYLPRHMFSPLPSSTRKHNWDGSIIWSAELRHFEQ